MPDADPSRPCTPLTAPICAQEARALFAPLIGRSSVAVAVSGGADSMACLRLVQRWAGEDPGRPGLTCLTVDHGLRPQSAHEAGQVARWCAQIDVPCRVLTWEGPHPKSNIQERARQARYDLMTAWCDAHATGIVVVAHHLEDQAETMLMRLARGSAIGGLGGMASTAKWEGVTIFRPFLEIARARLAASLKGFGQAWIEDPSNANPDFERVRVRAAMPGLAQIGLTPQGLARCARRAGRAATALDQIARAILEEAVEDGPVRLVHAKFLATPEEIQLRLLAGLVTRAGGAGLAHGRRLERAVAAMQAPDFSTLTLGRCRVEITNAWITVTREGPRNRGVRPASG